MTASRFELAGDQSDGPEDEARTLGDHISEPPRIGSRLPRRIGMALGLALLLGAVVMLVQRREEVASALEAMRAPSIALIALMLASVAANLILSSLTFSLLMSRYGRVGVLEMQAVIAATALLNFLPLRPGLFGRIAYHRAVNDIAVVDSAKVVVQAVVLTLCAAALLAGIALLSHRAAIRLEFLILLSGALLTLGALVPAARIWSMAGLIRYVEVLVWSVRYLAAFALIGSPIEPAAAIGLACISILATMAPLFSNGLGLREWLVGLLAPVIAGSKLELGLTAELLNRAAEIIIVLLMGGAGTAWLARRTRRE